MMYGFGDDMEPLKETTELMEQYVVEYLSNMCNRVLERSMRGGHSHMQLGDLIHVLKSDPKKYYRVPLILKLSKHIGGNKNIAKIADQA